MDNHTTSQYFEALISWLDCLLYFDVGHIKQSLTIKTGQKLYNNEYEQALLDVISVLINSSINFNRGWTIELDDYRIENGS